MSLDKRTQNQIKKIEKDFKLLELAKIEAEVKLLKERNEIYDTARWFPGKFIVLIGGSGSGKSYEIADIIIDRIVYEVGARPHRILCVRSERTQVTKSQFPLLKARALLRYPESEGYKWEINSAEGKEKIVLGKNEILFAGLDDVEKLKSIFDITSAWVEEADQVALSDIDEIDRRLRVVGFDMHIYISFNPVSVLSPIKGRYFDNRTSRTITVCGVQGFEDFTFYKALKLDKNALKEKVEEVVEGKKIQVYKYNHLIIHSTYKDNKFTPDSYYVTMADLKKNNYEEYCIYALGLWGVAGGTYFDKASINERIQANVQPIKRGRFEFSYVNERIVDETIQWVDEPDGIIYIYEEPKPGYPYVAGGDTAGEGSDSNTGYFTNNVTKQDVASLVYPYDEDLYTRQMYCLGKYYGELNSCNGNALLGIETKFSTYPVKELMRLGYNEQYWREERPDSMTGNMRKIYGFDTNAATRPTALGMLRTEMRENPERILDMQLLLEMTTFIKNEKGRPEAAKGAHDDCVMARAINCYISHQKTDEIELTASKRDYDEDDEDDKKVVNSFYD
jgi:phage terminase large subunit